MKRIVFYVVNASAEENQNGRFHFSKPFATVEEARKHASGIKDDFVVIEKHHEVLTPPPAGFVYKNPDREWELDHEAGGSEVVD